MKILVKKVGEPCEVKEVEKLELEDMQELVGGLVECMRIDFGVDDYPVFADVWLNEEGKINNLNPNFALFNEDGIVDVVVGDVFIADSRDGETIGLSDEQAKVIPQVFDILHANFHKNGDDSFYPISLIAV